MVKHVILWQLKDEFTETEKAEIRKGIKEALKGYKTHPEHVKVADGKVRPYTKCRICMDYQV